MEINLKQLNLLVTKRIDRIDEIIAGSGYKLKTVIGVGIFLLDNQGDLNLLTAKQQVTFEKFLQPLLDTSA